jgi:hypothetical protein
MLGLSACSIDGVGAASSEVFQANGAKVVRTQTYGIALRTAAEDAGVTIGYSSTLALIPDCAGAPPVGTHRFGVSLAGLRPIAVVRRTGGLAIDTNRRMVGFILGFAEDAVLSQVRAGQSIVRKLDLAPDEPAKTKFRQLPEDSLCN